MHAAASAFARRGRYARKAVPTSRERMASATMISISVYDEAEWLRGLFKMANVPVSFLEARILSLIFEKGSMGGDCTGKKYKEARESWEPFARLSFL